LIELVVEGGRQLGFVQGMREAWAFREVAWAFAERYVRLKYKQAALGIAWSVIQPLAFLSIFVILFGRLAHISSGSTPYQAFALSALVPWTYLQTAVSMGSGALMMDGGLMRKVYFAREAPVIGAVLATGLDFVIGLGLLLALGPFLGTHITWAIAFVLPLWVLLAVLSFGFALGFGALSVYYRDFRFVLPLFIQLWMFASPVAYPLTTVPEKYRALYVIANPAAGVLDGFRRVFALGQAPDVRLVGISALSTLIIAWAGYFIFRRMEPGFADTV
jgi:ABC-type polysaccharide/polyol phosphate export permease